MSSSDVHSGGESPLWTVMTGTIRSTTARATGRDGAGEVSRGHSSPTGRRAESSHARSRRSIPINAEQQQGSIVPGDGGTGGTRGATHVQQQNNYYRSAACRFELHCLDEWIRRKLRCYRLKQRKRGSSVARFLRRLGVSVVQAGRLAVSGKGPWRLAHTRQVDAAMSVEWFSQQGLVSLVVKYDALRH